MHAYHSNKMQGYTDDWVRLGGTPDSMKQACYTCHPGRNTKCLRGAMTETVNCQNCHGTMAAVGGMSPLKAGGSIDGTHDGQSRRPWMDLPRCQSCHTGDAVNYRKLDPSLMASDGLRAILAFDPTDAAASPRLASNGRFAENTASCSASARATAASPAKAATTARTRSGPTRTTRTTTTSRRRNSRDTPAP